MRRPWADGRLILTGLALLAALSACLKDSPGGSVIPPVEKNANGVGRVFGPDGSPAQGAAITLASPEFRPGPEDTLAAQRPPYERTTDAQGRFDLKGIPAGLYHLTARLGAGYAFLDSANLDPAARPAPNLALEPPGSLEGRAILHARHDPRVGLAQLLGTGLYARTDSSGRFEFPSVPGGRYTLKLTGTIPGYPSGLQSVRVLSGRRTEAPAMSLYFPLYVPPLPGDTIRLFDGIDEAASLTLATAQGILKIAKSDGSSSWYGPRADAFENNRIRAIAADGKGGYWLGLDSSRIAHLTDDRWVLAPPVPSKLKLMKLRVDAQGTLWARPWGYSSDGLLIDAVYRFDGTGWVLPDELSALTSNRYFADVELDGEGRPWLLDHKTVFGFDGRQWQVRAVTDSTVDDANLGGFDNLAISADGEIWSMYCGRKKGWALRYRNRRWEKVHPTNPYDADYIFQPYRIKSSRDGGIWLEHSFGSTRFQGDGEKLYGGMIVPRLTGGAYSVGYRSIMSIEGDAAQPAFPSPGYRFLQPDPDLGQQ